MSLSKTTIFIIFLFAALLAAGCGPSPEEQAATADALTAAAATDTPVPTSTPTDTPVPTATPTDTPTPTPTPVPYDLTVLVVDEGGDPIEGAAVTLAELDETAQTGPDGMLAWSDLPGESASLSAAAQGYLPHESTAALERGPNDVTLTLVRDPYGVLPAEACGSGETLVYLEDFQDGDAESWPEAQFNASGWALTEFSSEPGNFVMLNSMPEGHPHGNLDQIMMDQFALRFRYYKSANADISFNIVATGGYENDEGTVIEDSRYMVITYSSEGGSFELRRHQEPISGLGVRGTFFGLAQNEWHLIEISRFEGVVQVWADGTLVMEYEDPQPLPPGGFNIEIFESTSPEALPTFDNFALCELSAPFETLFTPEAPPEE